MENKILESVEGYAVNGCDTRWTVNCPECEHEYEYTGYFDSTDITKCKCGCEFTTDIVWVDEKHYIE